LPLRDLWLGASLLLIFVGLASGQGTLAVMGVLLLLAGGAARIWQRLALERVTYQRIFPETRAFVGEHLPFSVRLTNRKPLPLPWLEVREQFPEDAPPKDVRLLAAPTAKSMYVTKSTALSWYERLTWRYELQCQKRGYYRVGPAHISSSDIFGLFPAERQETEYQNIVVFPKTIPVPDIGLPSQRPFGERRGGLRIYQDPLSIAGLRDYEPGDSMRRIDWKATARRGALQSRVYEPSSTLQMLIAMNLTTFEQTWAGYDPILLERMVTMAASLATYANGEGYSVGLLANCSFPEADRPIRIAAGRHPQHLPRILEALATVGPFMISSIEDLMYKELHLLPLGTTVVLVTALLPESLLDTIARFRAAGHQVIVLSVRDEEPAQTLKGVPILSVGEYMSRFEMEQTYGS
jgi:uncharacterized protein (DUF58 family)